MMLKAIFDFMVMIIFLIGVICLLGRKSRRQQLREYLDIEPEPLIQWNFGKILVYLGLIIVGFLLWAIFTVLVDVIR